MNFLILDYFVLRSIAGPFVGSKALKVSSLPGGRSQIVERNNAAPLKSPNRAVKPRVSEKGPKAFPRELLTTIALTLVAAIVLGGMGYSKDDFDKREKMAANRLAEEVEALNKELFLWEQQYRENLDEKTFVNERKKMLYEYNIMWAPTFYNGEHKGLYTLSNPALYKKKDQLWHDHIEPYYRTADIPASASLRDAYARMWTLLEKNGFQDIKAETYNTFSHIKSNLDLTKLKNFIAEKKKEGKDDIVKKAEFLLEHADKALTILNRYRCARYEYYDLIKDKHIELLSIGYSSLNDKE